MVKKSKLGKQIEEALIELLTYSHGGTGQKDVTTAGTPERIIEQDRPCAGVYLQAKSGNTGLVYWSIGVKKEVGLSSKGVELDIGAGIWIPIDNLNKIWLDVETDGEGVCWAVLV